MSAIVDTKGEGSSRARRRPKTDETRKRRSGNGPRKPIEAEANEENKINRTEKRERPASIPVPSEYTGTTKEGVVSAIIKNGRAKFGFIHICPGPAIDYNTPKIYFGFSALIQSGLYLRKGDLVSFAISVDESERPFANDIKFTEAGKKLADERDTKYKEKQSQLKLEGNDIEKTVKPAVKKERRERKPLEDKPVSLNVTCEGKSDTKLLLFNKSQSIGKLKNIAVVAFDAPIEYNVYHGDTFLNKSILNSLSDNDKIHLAAPKTENA